jgi:hypothetical protein
LRQESRLRVFENRVLRRIFGPKRDSVTGDWRKLRNDELIDLYSSPNIIRVIKSRTMGWAEHLGRVGEWRDAYIVLVEKREGKRPFGKPRRKREQSIQMDLQEVGCGSTDYIDLAQDMDR